MQFGLQRHVVVVLTVSPEHCGLMLPQTALTSARPQRTHSTMRRVRAKSPRSLYADSRRITEHQAMDVLANLSSRRIAAIRDEFGMREDAVDKVTFIAILQTYLPEELLVKYATLPNAANSYGDAVVESMRPTLEAMIAALSELFDEMDSTGRGFVSWPQVRWFIFISWRHCIEWGVSVQQCGGPGVAITPIERRFQGPCTGF